ncbi:MAG: DUF2061 domain-containing protein [Candidatus Aenigmatarchaeota archaeon]|nr:MAG: DUF2061 domain-containing protein [Candidatus Aenigmarchaeota archaeon]
MTGETHRRSIAKAISWRVLATLTTMLLVYAFTARPDIALGVGLLEAAAKMVIYYTHERAWNSVRWGMMKEEAI